jgi:hypothetical protein
VLQPLEIQADGALKCEPISLEEFIYAVFWGDCTGQPVTRLCSEPLCWNPLHLRTTLHEGWIQPSMVSPMVLQRSLEESMMAQRIKANNKEWRLNYKIPIQHPLLFQDVIPGSKFNPL